MEVEALTRAHIQLQSDGIQLFLAVNLQICALGLALADQALDVFVAAALPRAMRVAEEDRHTGSLGDLGVSHHLPALVVGHALAHCQRHPIESCTEAFQRRGRRRIIHLHQIATGALHQGAYGRGAGLSFGQVDIPNGPASGGLQSPADARGC